MNDNYAAKSKGQYSVENVLKVEQ